MALKGLLGALLDIPQEEIVEIEFVDTTLPGEYEDEKSGILDLRILLNHSRRINVEMQTLRFPYWEERTLYYISKMYVEGFEKGQNYGDLEQCIHIGILDYDLYPNPPFYSRIGLWDMKNKRLYSSKFSLCMLELSQLNQVSEEIKNTDIYRWAKLLTTKDWEVFKMLAQDNEGMKAAQEELEKINADKELRYLYLRSDRSASDETTVREYYKKVGLEEGREEGREEGLQKGIIKGKQGSVLEILTDKGKVPETIRHTICAQQNVDILSRWIKIAAKAESVETFIVQMNQ